MSISLYIRHDGNTVATGVLSNHWPKYLSSILDNMMLCIPYKKSVVSKRKDIFSAAIVIVLAFIYRNTYRS